MLSSSKNAVTETPRVMFGQIPGHQSLAKVTNKITHHTDILSKLRNLILIIMNWSLMVGA